MKFFRSLVLFVGLFFVLPLGVFAQGVEIIQEKGIVQQISTTLKELDEGGEITHGGLVEGMYEEQQIKVEILSGENKGEVVEIRNDLYGNPFNDSSRQTKSARHKTRRRPSGSGHPARTQTRF